MNEQQRERGDVTREKLTKAWNKAVGDGRTIRKVRMKLDGTKYSRGYWCVVRSLGNGKESYYVLGGNFYAANRAIWAYAFNFKGVLA